MCLEELDRTHLRSTGPSSSDAALCQIYVVLEQQAEDLDGCRAGITSSYDVWPSRQLGASVLVIHCRWNRAGQALQVHQRRGGM